MPVAWALAELGVQHESVKFDLSKGDQRKPAFLALNPNGKVPTIVVDGTPMFEAVAIMQWLGDRFGVEKKLWPSTNDPARLTALSWTTWSYVSFGSAVGRLFMANGGPSGANAVPAQVEACKNDLDGLLSVLDGQLSKQAYLLSSQFSLADLIVASVIGWATMNKLSLDKHTHVRDWLERSQKRPSFSASRAAQ
jgi:GST-like protein